MEDKQMKILAYLPYIQDMQSVCIVRKNRLIFDGFAYELENNELRNSEMFNLSASDSTLTFEVY